MRKLLLFSVLLFSLPSLLAATDADNDGIGDEIEEAVAQEFLPLIYFSQEEQCPGPGALLYHVRPYAPGIDSVISIAYVLLFYDDCGSSGHKGDAESFGLTLYKDDSCSNGYRVHSLRTWAHEGVPICEEISTATIDRCDFGASEGDAVYVSRNKHALYRERNVCNDSYCEDECEAGLVMQNGFLVYPSSGQSWYMYNVGEPDYPLIEDLSGIGEGSIDFAFHLIWDYSHFCGDQEYSPGDYCPSTIVDKLFNCSSGPSLPVDVSFTSGGAVPSPMGFCRNQLLYLDLPYGGNIIAHIYNTAGDVTDKVFLPYFCQTDELISPYWDGVHMNGYCAPPANYYLVVEASRGDNFAQTDLIRFGIAGDEERPQAPTDLVGTGNSQSVSLSWQDNSNIEEAYLIERSFDTCPYRVIAILPENTTSYTDTPLYVGLARYRVFAHRTFGGNSVYSNEIELDLSWDLNTPHLWGSEAHNPHNHHMRWHFNPGGTPFDQYTLYKRYKHPQLGDIGEEVPPEWSQWIDIFLSYDVCDTLFTDSSVEYDICYEYKVEAVLNDLSDTLTSNIRGFHRTLCEGCPVLYVDSNEKPQRVTNLFPRIEYQPIRENVSDVAYIGKDIEEDGGLIRLRIEEVGTDTSYLDELSLLSINSPGSLLTGILLPDGIVQYRDKSLPVSATDSGGNDRLSLITQADHITYNGGAGSELIIDFDTGNCTDSLLGILSDPEDPQPKVVGPVIYIWDDGSGTGKWNRVCTLFPHQNRPTYLLNLARYVREDQAALRIKLECRDEVPIDCIFLTREHDRREALNKLELVRAASSSGTEVTGEVSLQDEISAVLENSESITLYYRKNSKAKEGNYYYLRARGRYVKGEETGM